MQRTSENDNHGELPTARPRTVPRCLELDADLGISSYRDPRCTVWGVIPAVLSVRKARRDVCLPPGNSCDLRVPLGEGTYPACESGGMSELSVPVPQPTGIIISPGSVQSVQRAFTLLEAIADHGGTMALSQLGDAVDLPLPTIHRLARTLVELGYLRQDADRHYVLGPALTRLGESATGTLVVWALPHLQWLVDELGESVNLATLEGDQIVYVAQVQSQRSMRMFTEVGRRVLPHSTAVGKAILSTMPRDDVRDLLNRTGMPSHTDSTITSATQFLDALGWSAEHGYALDEGEQEIGVRCVAVNVPNVSTRLAISVSGPATRMTEEVVANAVPLLQEAGRNLSADLARTG